MSLTAAIAKTDTAGNITTQTFTKPAAGGLASTSRYDSTGDEVERVWTMTGLTDPVLSESAVANIHGQQVDHTMMPGGHRAYSYVDTGRLTAVTDLDAGQCTTRAYRFDVNSNRTGSSSTTSAATADGSGDLTARSRCRCSRLPFQHPAMAGGRTEQGEPS